MNIFKKTALGLRSLLGVTVIAGTLTACSTGGAGLPAAQSASPERPTDAIRSTLGAGKQLRLLNGETVTILAAQKPKPLDPSELTPEFEKAIRTGTELRSGRLHVLPRGGTRLTQHDSDVRAAGAPRRRSASSTKTERRTSAVNTSGRDVHGHAGWFHSSGDSYGFTVLASDESIPALYPPSAGSAGDYVYYAPTTLGSDANPLEVGIRTSPNFPYAGVQDLYVFDWSGSQCTGSSFSGCRGFSYSKPINSAFYNNYMRDVGYGYAEYSIETLQYNGGWYFALFNQATNQWEFPYYQAQSRSPNLAVENGWGMWEMYVPQNTGCASYDPSNPSTATTIMTNSQQYSPTSGWVRMSNDPYAYQNVDSDAYYCTTAPSPYYAFSVFGDGRSQWRMVPQ